jgi:hypothetical protein
MVLSGCGNDTEGSIADEIVVASCDTTQIFGTPQHGGKACAPPSTLSVVATVVNDPAAQQEHDDFGFLAVHYGAALTSGSMVYVPGKSGYTDLSTPGTQTWSVQALQWVGATLQPRWNFNSSFQPVDALFPFEFSNGYEQLFQPVLVPSVPHVLGGGLYVPASSGRVSKLDPTSGVVLTTIDPLAGTPFSGDENVTITSSLVASGRGEVAYTVTAWTPDGNVSVPPRDAWLVRIAPDDSVTLKPWAAIASASVGVKQGNDQCTYFSFFRSPRPLVFPPTPDDPPFTARCTPQRPALNAPPTFTADGKRLLLTSTANNSILTSYLIAVSTANLAPVWAASLAGHILDGCGVLIPFDSIGDFGFHVCPVGTHIGVEPFTNQPGAGREDGLMETAPVEAPDGSIYLASYTGGYDDNRSHLFRFSSGGGFLGVRDYAWETSPTIWQHDGGFSLLSDDSSTTDGTDSGGTFATARLAPDFTVQTRTVFQNEDVESNNVLDGQPALDTEGNAYVLHAAGRVEKIDQTGQVTAKVELPGVSMEALSSETSWGRDGFGRPVLYVPFAGTMWVIGEGGAGGGTTAVKPRASSRANGANRRGAKGVRTTLN